MTSNERIEALLNRAGQTISDLPNCEKGMAYSARDNYVKLLEEAEKFVGFKAPAGFEIFNALQYALHLTDVIDRMETALENVLGERDYHFYGCEVKGVPEYWRVDDD